MSLIKPDVFAQLVREKFEGRSKILSMATNLGDLKNTTVGETVTFPFFKLITEATEVVKGTPISTEDLEQDSTQATIKQIGKGVRVYDIDDLTALGNHVNEAADQIAKVMIRKVEMDLIDEAMTTPLQQVASSATALTKDEIDGAFQFFGDEADVEEFQNGGMVINSLLIPSMYGFAEFVASDKTFTTEGSGIQRRGLLGFWRGVPVYVANHGTFVANECATFIIKNGALGYMEKRGVNVELERKASLKATDIYGDMIFANKLVRQDGVVLIKKTLPVIE